jgi:replicative DNA helicase
MAEAMLVEPADLGAELRVPPHSIPAERAVLGAAIVDHVRAWPVVADLLSADAFYERTNIQVFRAIERLSDSGTAVDVVTVGEAIECLPEFAGEGLAFAGQLAEAYPVGSNVRGSAAIVATHAERRQVIAAASTAIDRAFRGDEPTEIIADLDAEWLALTSSQSKGGPREIGAILSGYADELASRAEGRSVGLPTGFSDLDRLTHGLRPGQLIVIAGRPGAGKTAFACNLAEHAAVQQGRPVLIFSLEMGERELLDRFAASISGLPVSALLRGDVSDPRLLPALDRLKAAPLHIDDSPALRVEQVRARALGVKRRHDLAMVVVDYLQLLRAKAERRHEEVATISRALKALAKELAVPVIALSQLNRASESRNDKRPTLADLRESGQIEQDADLVALLYRDPTHVDGVVALEIAKQRSGPTGRVLLADQLDRARFRSHEGPVVRANAKDSDDWNPYTDA